MGCTSSTQIVDLNPIPPTVSWLLEHRHNRDIIARHYPHCDPKRDSPLATIYRIYVAIVAGEDLSLRSEIEYFFNHPGWKVRAIPDPKDPDVTRYTVLAAIPYLLIEAFNRLIEMGLPRGAPAIISCREEEEELKARPKLRETVPAWAERVQPLHQVLKIPDSLGYVPPDIDDGSADTRMLRKNILTTALPIFFI